MDTHPVVHDLVWQAASTLLAETVTTADAAAILGQPEVTVRSYLWHDGGRGRLRTVQLGRAVRICRADVLRYRADREITNRVSVAIGETLSCPIPRAPHGANGPDHQVHDLS